MAGVKRSGRGGPRSGSGRPRGTGGPPEAVRRNRVVVMLTDVELAALHRLAKSKALPLGTVAYELVRRALQRVARSIAVIGFLGLVTHSPVARASLDLLMVPVGYPANI